MKHTKHHLSIGMRFVGQYGTSTVTGFERSYRIEEWVPHDNPDQWDTERSFAVDKYDCTPDQKRSNYDSKRCGTCWLGYAHTEAYHAQNVAAYEAQSVKAKAEQEQHAQWKAFNL